VTSTIAHLAAQQRLNDLQREAERARRARRRVPTPATGQLRCAPATADGRPASPRPDRSSHPIHPTP
jgi:hypothetical protein